MEQTLLPMQPQVMRVILETAEAHLHQVMQVMLAQHRLETRVQVTAVTAAHRQVMVQQGMVRLATARLAMAAGAVVAAAVAVVATSRRPP